MVRARGTARPTYLGRRLAPGRTGASGRGGDGDAVFPSGLDLGSLRSEIQQRYDAALALSTDPAIVSGDNSRYVWANEAKVQCGIALGYLKSSTRDEVSIGKCEMAARLMNRVPAPYTPPPPPVVAAPPPEVCSQRLPGIVFFEFDSATLPADATQTIEFVSRNAAACNWTAFDVVGHTDRSGSNAYNMGLSERRAEAVASLMASLGIARSAISTSAQGEEQLLERGERLHQVGEDA